MRILITGVGVLTTVGIGASRTFENMLLGQASGRPEIPDFDPKLFLGNRGIRHFDRTGLLLASGARLAADQRGLDTAGYRPEEFGVVVGSTHGSIQAIAEFDQEAVREGPNYVNPQDFANTVINAPASRVSIMFGYTGLNSTIASGAASALDALNYGLSMLRSRRIGVLLCGCALGYSREIAEGYGRIGKMVPAGDGCVPFASGRRGATLAEGAAVFVLEEEASALSRGAHPLAVVAGVGSAFSTDASGLTTAMKQALAQAELGPEQISCIVSFASGSPAGDFEEGEALGGLFDGIPVTAPKSLTGDCLEASGAIHLAVAVHSIQGGKIPPIARLQNIDPAFSRLDLVRGAPRQGPVDHVLVNAREDSGHCASAVISKLG
jgi:3-oxoacyl-[acyl-carrier-protein] synthase II